MKKLLLSLLLSAVCLSAHAQRGNAFNDNTLFWSFNAGATLYQHSGNSDWGVPMAGLYVGRWLMRPLAFRVAADVAMAPSHLAAKLGKSDNSFFFMGSAEFMWDVNATFFHVYNKRFLYPVPFYPLIGLGVVYRPGFDALNVFRGPEHDIQAMLGVNVPVQISHHWDLYLEYRFHMFAQGFDGSKGDNFMHAFVLGLNHRVTNDPFRRRTAFETRTNNDDWFVGFGAGLSFSSFEFEYYNNLDARLYNFTPEIMIGRNYNSVWTIRFELSGFIARERAHMVTDVVNDGTSVVERLQNGSWYSFNVLHADFMINLTHLLNFRRGVKWNFLPYLGAGPAWRYQAHPRFDVAANAGFMARRFINNEGDFYIDLKYIIAAPRLAGETGPSGSVFGVGYPMLTFGYIHNFGHSTTRYRMPVNSTIN